MLAITSPYQSGLSIKLMSTESKSMPFSSSAIHTFWQYGHQAFVSRYKTTGFDDDGLGDGGRGAVLLVAGF